MSPPLFARSPDLQRLVDDGYEVSVRGAFLLITHVPYVNSDLEVKLGTLVSNLHLAGDKTLPPDTHVVHFAGEYPCRRDGSPILPLRHQSKKQAIGDGISVDHSFSNKPPNGYPDYYEKMTTYVTIISSEAEAVDPSVTAKTHHRPAADQESVFQYLDTHSPKADIAVVTEKLKGQTIGIFGVGGTGSYVLDQVAKTPVQAIHLYDGDRFLQHNAFRAPGAASLDDLSKTPFKTDYYRGIYARMHRHVYSHPHYLAEESLQALPDLTFVFVCIDKGPAKRAIFTELERRGIPFVDVGMGVESEDAKLAGILRATLSTPSNRALARDRVSFHDDVVDAAYKSNIQIADLNMFNAALAVMKWKKFFGLYRDIENELHSTYTIDVNMLLSEGA